MEMWKLGEVGSIPYRFYDFLRNCLNAKLADYLYGSVGHGKAIAVIEAGSGPGFCASLLRKKKNVFSAKILDIDPEVIRLARLRDGLIETIEGSILNIPFPENSFDLVYNSSTIEHLDDYKKAFSEMVRICKPGGRVFVGVPSGCGPLAVFNIFPPNGKIRAWVGKFIGFQEIRGWTEEFPVGLLDERDYFFWFFKGFLFQKHLK